MGTHVPTINVLKNIIFHLKINIFTAVKYCCLLHGLVCVMPHFLLSVCRGSSERLVRHGTFQHQYDLYKQRYTNCTYVKENLEITNLERNFDLSFLKDIEEVMGYVIIVNVFSNYLNLTNLRIIRGETLYDANYSLYVALNHNPYNDSQGIMELQFTSLSGK